MKDLFLLLRGYTCTKKNNDVIPVYAEKKKKGYKNELYDQHGKRVRLAGRILFKTYQEAHKACQLGLRVTKNNKIVAEGKCKKQTLKKYRTRPSPPIPANTCPPGTTRIGNDGRMYIVKKYGRGIANRWVVYKEKYKF